MERASRSILKGLIGIQGILALTWVCGKEGTEKITTPKG
jgi:hypothetical protein